MPRIVNVILNSNNKTGGTNNQANYSFDWGAVLKNNVPYYLHFTYIGGANTITGTKLATVYSDIQTTNKQNTSTNSGAGSTQMLGYLKIQQYAPNNNTNYLTAEDNTNPPLYLDNRPMNNNFTISIFDNAAPPVLFLDNAATPAQPANYILILSFQEYESNEI